MNIENLARLETIIFVAEKPVGIDKLSRVMDMKISNIRPLLEKLQNEYSKESHGFELNSYDDNYVFETKKKYSDLILNFMNISKHKKLSPAALETLAIVAYEQPITRREIESIRGVNVERTLSTLEKYDLVEEKGRKETIGNPIIYGTTTIFLQKFGLDDISDLPKIEDIDYQKVFEDE
ncbi:MAG TPA: SMC-Scp complex subunit ScpB [Halanaerobiales bacterium]|nr:SMC-Scp complex subunit ScpB [Halanaerobiales bacterium]